MRRGTYIFLVVVIGLIVAGGLASKRYEPTEPEIKVVTKTKTKVVYKDRVEYRLPKACAAVLKYMEQVDAAASTFSTQGPRQRAVLSEFKRAVQEGNVSTAEIEDKQKDLEFELGDAYESIARARLVLGEDLIACEQAVS